MGRWHEVFGADSDPPMFCIEGLEAVNDFKAGDKIRVTGQNAGKYRVILSENFSEDTWLWVKENIPHEGPGGFLRKVLNVLPEQVRRRKANGRFQAMRKRTK